MYYLINNAYPFENFITLIEYKEAVENSYLDF